MSPETPEDMKSRLELMADGDPTWDLSDNDKAAIRWALNAIANVPTHPVEEGQEARPVDLEAAADALRSIIIRCVDGDKRANWLPIIKDLAEKALSALARSRPQEEGKAEPRPGGLRSIEQAADLEKLALKRLAYAMVNEWFRWKGPGPQPPIADLMMNFHHAASQAPTAQSAPPPAGPTSPLVEPEPVSPRKGWMWIPGHWYRWWESGSATAWPNGTWHTFDADGVGGENASDPTVGEAMDEAEKAIKRQGFDQAHDEDDEAPALEPPAPRPMDPEVDGRPCRHCGMGPDLHWSGQYLCRERNGETSYNPIEGESA